MRDRLKELDYFRVFCMLAVIGIHVSSVYIFIETKWCFEGVNFAYFLNQMTRFAVPGFILLSGISLSLGKMTSWGAFYQKRFGKILIPYFLWSCIYYVNNQGFNVVDIVKNSNIFFWRLLTGGNASHLYFIVVLIQLYLLYPFLLKLKEKAPVQLLCVSFFLTFMMQQWIYQQVFQIFVLPRFFSVYGWLLAPTWLFYFVLGMYGTKERLYNIFEWGRKHLFFLTLFLSLFLYCYVMNSVRTKTFELSINTALMIYVPLIFVFVGGLVHAMDRKRGYRPETPPRMERIMRMLSDRSMSIYFSHVIFLSILKNKPLYTQGMRGMFLLYGSVLLLSLLFSEVIYRIEKSVKKQGTDIFQAF